MILKDWLQDSRRHHRSLADRFDARMGMQFARHHTDDGGTGGGGGGAAEDPPTDLPADPPPKSDDLTPEQRAEHYQARKREVDAQNKRLKADLKAEAEARAKLEARLTEIERANMSEAEKIKADAEAAIRERDELKAKLIEKDAAAALADRMRIAAAAGAQGDAAQKFIAHEIAAAQAADGEDFDQTKFLEKFKTDNPGFFGATPPPATSGGHQRGGNTGATGEQQAAEIETKARADLAMGNITAAQHAGLLYKAEQLRRGLPVT